MRIGFYGDSFCCEISNPHSILKSYSTYIKKLQTYYSAEIINLGIGGSSVWDVILQQFDTNDVPDICIFCWTDPNRLYHKKIRNITLGSIENKKLKDLTFSDLLHYKTIAAAKEYFKHIHDFEKTQIEYLAALQYFDINVLTNIKSKIIHLWSFESAYQWKNGSSINIPLMEFVTGRNEGFDTWAANHIASEENNDKLFQMIKKEIDGQHRPSS